MNVTSSECLLYVQFTFCVQGGGPGTISNVAIILMLRSCNDSENALTDLKFSVKGEFI